jgi:hypothetical protein
MVACRAEAENVERSNVGTFTRFIPAVAGIIVEFELRIWKSGWLPGWSNVGRFVVDR